MRKTVDSPDGTFRVKAFAGTSGVLLAFDLDESRKRDLVGFAVRQKEAGKQWQWLLSSLTFPGKAHTIPRWNATPSNLAPIQKFRWADYSIDPGTTCSYRVYPAYATSGNPRLEDPIEVTVRTDDGNPAGHAVAFNRAVAASQSFGRQFPEIDQLLNENKELPVERWPKKPRQWLENGLLDRIVKFIGRATGPSWALDIAIYEYELKAIVDAVNAAHKRGVEVRVIYHARAEDEQTHENEASLRRIPKSKKRARVTSKIFHNKFIVLSKVSSDGKRTPKAVLCGSTNFTENGLYRQANVVHIVEADKVAQAYLNLFQVIWDAPADVPAARKWINSNNPMNQDEILFAGFSPRSGGKDLAEFVRIINGARRDVLFATAFSLPDAILDALLGQDHDDVLRFGIQNTASRISGFHADRSAEFTATALLSKGLEGWVKEGLKGQRGRLLVHTKVVVTNFTSDRPSIISGSHNLSNSASSGNDENYLIMSGDPDLADRYGIEILRFYEHYRFRYYVNKLRLKEVRPLTVDNSWAADYYRPGHLKQLARVRFAGR